MMQDKLVGKDFNKFVRVDKKKMDSLENMLSVELPKLLQMVPDEISQIAEAHIAAVGPEASPFAVMKVGGATETSVWDSQWLVAPDPEACRAEFMSLGPNSAGKISGQRAKEEMVKSRLP